MNCSRPLLLSLALLFASCGKEDTVPPPVENTLNTILKYLVAPNETDANISSGLNDQFAFVAEDPKVRKNRLFIFLPGTLAKPSTYLKINQTAAEYGYHSFGIDYRNNRTIDSFCNDTADGHCDYNALTEFFEGIDASPDSTASVADSFVN